MKAAPSGLLFPDADGKMLSRHTPLEDVLRRALAHAGIVEGWEHVCRKRGCGHSELVSDDKLRHCPRHGMKLWPKARVRRIRFHDLRHYADLRVMPMWGSTRAPRRAPAVVEAFRDAA